MKRPPIPLIPRASASASESVPARFSPLNFSTMQSLDFPEAFEALTGSPPFPWQSALYAEFTAAHFGLGPFAPADTR